MGILKSLAIIGLKALLFIVGAAACLGMLTGCMYFFTEMSFVNSAAIAVLPSLAFGIWCSKTINTEQNDRD